LLANAIMVVVLPVIVHAMAHQQRHGSVAGGDGHLSLIYAKDKVGENPSLLGTTSLAHLASRPPRR
jgi:hypothetical protein